MPIAEEKRFSPLFGVPLERRLQTLIILLWWIEPSFASALFLYLCTWKWFLPFAIAYGVWIYFDKAPERGGRRVEFMRNLTIWRWFADYFPARIVKEGELDPSKNYLFGYHPHGIIAMGAVCTFASEGNGFSKLYPGIKPSLGTLASNFRIPFHRDYILAQGLCSVSRKSCKAVLSSGPGRSMAIVVGGAAESLVSRPGTINLVLKKRLGFVRIAVETGASLVPVLSFGENDMFKQVKNEDGSFIRTFQKKTQQILGFTFPLFYGRGIFNYDRGLMPFRSPMHIVIGNPIDPPKNVSEENFNDMVAVYHKQYVQALQDLYDKYKDVYAKDRTSEMIFVE